MRRTVGLFLFLLSTSLSAALLAGAQNSSASDSSHVIEVTAKTFEFIPNEIHVKAGERVQIKLHSADRAHGLKLNLYPEGASADGTPGLVFEHPQDDAKVDKHKDRTIEFVAARPGTYDFICSVQCSMGHGHDRMTGKLIVEE
ncbi:MAG TPA: cupredoxin domain-containing protein [Candidatus Acidoferrales bacterium]|jgi:heme/copper-type cytochrome/quinol oxidase subunit 2|nr:cupredoxin domain-containing protein [Candidatus Acidoferrales bacterium]